MKIAFVYDAVYPWIKGGAEKRIYELGKRLVKQGHEVHVFGIKWWDGAEIISYEGMVLHGVCSPMELYINGRRSIYEAVVFSIRLFPHLIREKFDLIDASAFPYFSCFSAKLVSVLRRTRIVVTWYEVWGGYWYEYLGWQGFFGKLVEYLASKLTSEQIALSSLTKKNLESLGINHDNIQIVPGGIDLKRIAGIHPSNEVCDVLFAGRLIGEKNVDVLLGAIGYARNSLPSLTCHIIGDGPEKERLKSLTAKYGLFTNVRFFGFMGYDELISRIKSSKVLVLPSSREGFGIVVIEAFACGVPVITVRGGRNAASLLVNEETGLVINLDASEMGTAIQTLINDAGLRERMSLSAVNAAKKYEWDNIVRRLLKIYMKK